MIELTKAEKQVLAKLVGSSDPGGDRLRKAHRQKAAADEAIRMVAQRHGLQEKVVTKCPPGLRNQHHVVMARSHAASVLSDLGMPTRAMGRALGCDHRQARRLAQRWDDHLSGRLSLVTEAEAKAVDDLIAKGCSTVEACDRIGVGVTRYESRKIIMRLGK